MTVTDINLAQEGDRLAGLLMEQGWSVATAESCTGGWVAKVLTDRAGSSAYVYGGLVTYSNEAKKALLGVSEEALREFGAVSELVVRQMVAGTLAATGVDVAIAISGVAGPGGGSEDKPVGTVWFAWGRGNHETEARLKHFAGDRDAVRRQAVSYALQGVSDYLERS